MRNQREPSRLLLLLLLLAGVSLVRSYTKGGSHQHQQQRVDDPLVLEVSQGRIRGQEKEGPAGKAYYEFLGIPFAQPPTGALRFKPPVPATGWSGERDGTQQPVACPQIDLEAGFLGKEVVEGEEDCLYLNVFTPRLVSQEAHPGESLPVMVFIPGGSFTLGAIQSYNPSPLVHRDVIVVTIQYRLGILGFASTEDDVLPGNLGLRDQHLALFWVKENIHSFGGDSTRVTLYGQSAGSASAHLQAMSPHARDLFQRVILQSGSALNPWTIGTNHRELAFKLSEKLNCHPHDSNDVLNCLNRTSLHDLVFSVHLGAEYCLLVNLPRICTAENVWNYRLKQSLPRVDGDFIPDYPARLLKEGRLNPVDVISGITQHEGVALAFTDLLSQVLKGGSLRPRGNPLGALGLLLDQEEDGEYLATRAALHYLPTNLSITLENIDALTSLIGDRIYKVGHEDAAEFHAQAGQKVYQYRFTHRGQFSYTVFINTSHANNYTAHIDDLIYIFDQLLTGAVLTRPEDLFIREIMTRMWTNFAKTGNPTVNGTLGFRWQTCGPQNGNYLAISTKPRMWPSYRQTRNMWRSLPTKDNKILFPENFTEDMQCYK